MELTRLKEWRESRGLMQQEVAKKAKVSARTVMRAEHGESVQPPTARKIAKVLEVSVADLMENPPVPFFDPQMFRVPPVEEFDLDKLENEIIARTQPESLVQLRERAREVLAARYTERELMELRDIYIARARELAPTEPFEGDVDLDAYTTAVTVANLASRALERVVGRQPA